MQNNPINPIHMNTVSSPHLQLVQCSSKRRRRGEIHTRNSTLGTKHAQKKVLFGSYIFITNHPGDVETSDELTSKYVEHFPCNITIREQMQIKPTNPIQKNTSTSPPI